MQDDSPAQAELRVPAGVSGGEIQQTPAPCRRRALQKALPAKRGRCHTKEQISDGIRYSQLLQ